MNEGQGKEIGKKKEKTFGSKACPVKYKRRKEKLKVEKPDILKEGSFHTRHSSSFFFSFFFFLS